MMTYRRSGRSRAAAHALFGASLGLLMLGATAGYAQTATNSGAQGAQTAQGVAATATGSEASVTVTANRREATTVMAVPAAVDAFSGKTLQVEAVHTVSDLAKIDPSLDVITESAQSERVIIRGVSSDVGATTGIYVDETPLQGGFNDTVPGDNIPKLGLQDVDHVEVLKGPQGTLFGAGSMDGTVRIVTNQPNLQRFGGWVEGSAADVENGNALYQGSGAINLPLFKDTLGVRFVGWGADGGGDIDQTINGVTRHNVNDIHEAGVRALALWQPTDRLSLTAAAAYQDIEVYGAEDWNRFIGGIVTPNSPYVGPLSPYHNVEPSQNRFSQKFQLYSLTARYRLDFGNIIENTAYGWKNEIDVGDTSAQDCVFGLCPESPFFKVPAAIFTSWPLFSYLSEDVRFASQFSGPFQLVVGLYSEHDHQVFTGTVVDTNAAGAAPCYTWQQCTFDGLVRPGSNFAPPSSPRNVVQFANSHRQTTDQVAFYTQADYKITRDLTATVGFRYFTANLENTEITLQNITPAVTPLGPDCGYEFGCVTVPYLASRTNGHEGQPTYNFALRWAATPDLSVYARAASGFRLGGINESSTIAAEAGVPIPSTFGPDQLWDYEVGLKAYFLQHRLFVDLAAYHIDWTNEQESAEAIGVFGYTLNVGKSDINGIELNSTFSPIPDLTLSGSITYVNAVLGQDLPASVAASGTPGVKGNRLPFVPNWSFAGQGEYDHHFGDLVGYVQFDFTYHGDSFTAFEPSPPGIPNDFYTQLPAYFLLDAAVGVRWANYDATVFAQNLTDSAAWLAADANNGGVLVHSPRPLTIGVRLNAKY